MLYTAEESESVGQKIGYNQELQESIEPLYSLCTINIGMQLNIMTRPHS